MGWETNFDRQSFGSSYVDILNKIKYNKKIENTHAYITQRNIVTA